MSLCLVSSQQFEIFTDFRQFTNKIHGKHIKFTVLKNLSHSSNFNSRFTLHTFVSHSVPIRNQIMLQIIWSLNYKWNISGMENSGENNNYIIEKLRNFFVF